LGIVLIFRSLLQRKARDRLITPIFIHIIAVLFDGYKTIPERTQHFTRLEKINLQLY